MSNTTQIAKHIKEVFFGGNWTWVNLETSLKEVSWQQATTKVYQLNTIAQLTFHIDYYTRAIISVLQGEKLVAHDKYSFDCPEISNETDWELLKTNAFKNATTLIGLVENNADEVLNTIFVEEKYGNYWRNFHGFLEHTHYHLGQIVVIKKILQSH